MRNIMGTRKTTLTDRQYSYQPARLAWPILFRGRENVVNGFATPELIDEPENQLHSTTYYNLLISSPLHHKQAGCSFMVMLGPSLRFGFLWLCDRKNSCFQF